MEIVSIPTSEKYTKIKYATFSSNTDPEGKEVS